MCPLGLACAAGGLGEERTKTLVEMVHWVRPYFGEAVPFDEDAAKKFHFGPGADDGKLVERFEAFPAFTKQEWEEAFKKLVEEAGLRWASWLNRCV
ncbi:MAG: hypothetical protein MRJ92_00815 [Nitrospira sp.]|nr:hypothetical protein [Nitrospira sp.]